MGQQGCWEAYLPPEILKDLYVLKRKCQERIVRRITEVQLSGAVTQSQEEENLPPESK